jgi:hypothetical protein
VGGGKAAAIAGPMRELWRCMEMLVLDSSYPTLQVLKCLSLARARVRACERN